MPTLNQQRTHKYMAARQQHPAPLVLSCFDVLFDRQRGGVPFDAAVQALADMLAALANGVDSEIYSTDPFS